MNIKINKEQFERLYQHKEEEHIFGSRLYGTAREDSDTDIMVIYDSRYAFGTPLTVYGLPNIHQFQYDDTENNKQYVFSDMIQFAKNMQSGDSTINAEIMMFMDETTKNDIPIFRTYKIIKAFLGFAKRDLKRKKKGYESHVMRGLYIVQTLIANQLPSIIQVKHWMNDPLTPSQMVEWEKNLRMKLNFEYNHNGLPLYCIPEVNDPLLQLLLNSNNTKEFKYNNK